MAQKILGPFHGLARGQGAQHVQTKTQPVRRLGLHALRAQQAVDVLAFGHQDHGAGQAAGEQHLAGAQGGLAAGAVPVEQQGELRGETRKALDLVRGQGGAQHAHGIVVAELVQGQHVHVAFGQKGPSLYSNAFSGLGKTVKMLSFLVDGRIGTVDVLGFVLVRDDAPAKGDDLVGKVLDGKDEAAPEAVIDRAPFRASHQSGLGGQMHVIARALQGQIQRMPVAPRPAQAEALHDLRAQAPPLYVGPAFLGLRAFEGRGEVGRRQFVHAQHGLAGRTPLPVFFLPFFVHGPALQGDAGLGGQLLQGLAEIQAVDAAVEIEDVPRGLTAETVEQALFLVDRETGLGLLMEGAGRHPARSVALEIHITAHDIRDVEPLLDGADGISGLHEAPAGLSGRASAG